MRTVMVVDDVPDARDVLARLLRMGGFATVTAQDGDKTFTLTAREVSGEEREHWWKLAVEAYPPYAEYQTKTDRLIPVFVLE